MRCKRLLPSDFRLRGDAPPHRLWAKLHAYVCLGALCLASCKPLTRPQEDSAPQFVEIVSKLKRLADAEAFKSLRAYVRSHIANKRASEVGRAISNYMQAGQAGNAATIRSYMRSYTHSAAGAMIDADIGSIVERLATSKNKQQMNELLESLVDKTQAMKGLYTERNKVLNSIVDGGEEHYQLLLDTRNDFHSWYSDLNKDLRASLAKFHRQTTGSAMLPSKLNSDLIKMRDNFESFYRSIGIRTDRSVGY